ncbi:cyclic nucleotide-binding domain-containing protein [Chitinophaga sp. Mgbs1]|uniref:Cyclic nucleotide-binding domain-containing protein n=1 Tax=Chitinophaga solisilvae TaxID=1233460 RepID=A0A3S1D2Y3_9BACT|nr:cyclic nucleotide-binding domain-containing protein [Chitinophaga solisilvae]
MFRILIITDKPAQAKDLRNILEGFGHETITAVDGKSGIEAARLQLPDAILCSAALKGGIDGSGVLEVLRRDSRFQLTPFVLLAEKYQATVFRTAMNLGADDFLVKPFSNHDLLQTIETRCRRWEAAGTGKQEHSDFKKVVKDFLENRNTIRAAAPETIYHEGGTPRFLYYIISGKVKTIKTHEDGKDLVIGLYNKGDFFGYIALLEEETYKATAVVMEDAEIALIPKEDAEALFDHTPVMVQRFMRMLARNVTEKEERLLGIAYNTLRKKVASALIHLRNKYQQDRAVDYTIHIPRDELAALAGTATESLIRTLGEFKNEKLIAVKNTSITLRNPGKLEDIAYH